MSYDCNINNDRLTGAFNSTYDVTATVDRFTLCAWIKRSAAQWADGTDARIVVVGEDTVDQNDSLMLWSSTTVNQMRGSAIDSGALIRDDVLTHTINTLDDVWILWGVVFGSDILRELFQDGVGTGSPSTILVNMLPVGAALAIGNNPAGGFASGNCLVAEVGMWNIALSDAEMLSLFDSAETGIPMTDVQGGNCVGYWPLLVDQATHQNLGVDTGGLMTVESGMPFSSDHPTILSADIENLSMGGVIITP